MGIYAMSADGDRRRRLTDAGADAIHPAWAIAPQAAEPPEGSRSAKP
jgi:hypothetical protein